MSLVLAWVAEKYIAICCDGKMIHKHPDGTVTSAGENRGKFHRLTEGIVLAALGDAELGPELVKILEPFAQRYRKDLTLFRCLEIGVPFYARWICRSRTYDVPQEHTVLLFGYDADRQRLRGVGWDSNNDFTPVQIGPGNIIIAGHEEGKLLADARVDGLCTNPTPSPESALACLESIVQEVGNLVPERVNANTRGCVLAVPSANRDLVKTASVDASGNLKLKNVNDAVGTTSSPQTSSTTYSVIPEMTQTLTFKGNKVLLVFSMTVQTPTGSHAGTIAIFKDGVQLSQDYWCEIIQSTITQGILMTFAITFIDAPSAASHTYDVRWKTNSTDPISCSGTARRFQIVELG